MHFTDEQPFFLPFPRRGNVRPQQRVQYFGAQRQKLVILGSGWGATSLLKGIDVTKYDVTVVSPRNHFLVRQQQKWEKDTKNHSPNPYASRPHLAWCFLCSPPTPAASRRATDRVPSS